MNPQVTDVIFHKGTALLSIQTFDGVFVGNLIRFSTSSQQLFETSKTLIDVMWHAIVITGFE